MDFDITRLELDRYDFESYFQCREFTRAVEDFMEIVRYNRETLADSLQDLLVLWELISQDQIIAWTFVVASTPELREDR